MDIFVRDEISRVNAQPVVSDFESDVKSEIMIWGYKINEDRIERGIPPIKFSSFEDLAKAFWNERFRDYGKLRAIR